MAKINFRFLTLFFLLVGHWCFSQDYNIKEVDSLYKEDQFYIGVTYNLIGKQPQDLSQTGFSTGFYLGFINDIPLNKKRDFALGIGLGYSINSFNQNLLISKDNTGNFSYSILDANSTYSKNKFYNHLLEVPLEFRWRTSTPTEYKFWRIYTGFKLGYIFSSASKYNGDSESFKYNGISDFNKLQYGLTLSAGYNTWNIHVYYGLNPIFSKEAVLNGSTMEMNAIKIGLMFYIL